MSQGGRSRNVILLGWKCTLQVGCQTYIGIILLKIQTLWYNTENKRKLKHDAQKGIGKLRRHRKVSFSVGENMETQYKTYLENKYGRKLKRFKLLEDGKTAEYEFESPFVEKVCHFVELMARPFEKTVITAILMCMLTVPTLGFIMGKDYEYKVATEITESSIIGIYDITESMHQGIREGLEAAKIKPAPSVLGLKVGDAKIKLGKANIKDIKVEKAVMVYEDLVEQSETLFFGEVKNQKQSVEGVTLTVPEADMSDPLTAEMVSLGGRLAWPVPSSHAVTSHFGHRNSPGGIGSTNHKGMDIGAVRGTPIIAAKAGEVKLAAPNGGYGNCVVIQHDNNYETLYGHMSVITCNVGDKVKPGDIIGKVGSTGWSTGPHLHFSILKNGEYVDPEPYFTGKINIEAGEEVSENQLGEEETTTTKTEETTTDKTDSTEPSTSTAKPTEKITENPTGKTDTTKPITPTTKKPESTTKSPTVKPTTKPTEKPTTVKPTTVKPTEPPTTTKHIEPTVNESSDERGEE